MIAPVFHKLTWELKVTVQVFLMWKFLQYQKRELTSLRNFIKRISYSGLAVKYKQITHQSNRVFLTHVN